MWGPDGILFPLLMMVLVLLPDRLQKIRLALEFDPDRFLDERLHKYLTPNPYIFTPFNAGPRICLGQQVRLLSLVFPLFLGELLTRSSHDHKQFAYQETSFFLIRLLQQFTGFSLAPDAQPEGTRPPESWAGCAGSKGSTKVWPGLHLTMYVRVSCRCLCFAPCVSDAFEFDRVDFG